MKKLLIAMFAISILGFNVSQAESIWDTPVVAMKDSSLDIVVYRSPTCGCCGKWLDHLKAHGFNVHDNVLEDMQHIKDKYGINNSLASCHTAIIDGYIVEGHVPANDIKAMLLNKPEIKGLAVPGMVAGTPGMEMGGKKAPFNVVAFDKDGQITLYKAYDQY
ncbi:DUF411 domain-containing protein [Bathymodiolus platifrons methanotrophic gill symbiont]|nr:DUF411 domain-containing protein [Bathymodiolus platifrons methanotrophic gill symbiont]